MWGLSENFLKRFLHIVIFTNLLRVYKELVNTLWGRMMSLHICQCGVVKKHKRLRKRKYCTWMKSIINNESIFLSTILQLNKLYFKLLKNDLRQPYVLWSSLYNISGPIPILFMCHHNEYFTSDPTIRIYLLMIVI